MALGITHPDIEMRSQTGRQLESATYTRQCKDFLCSQESKLKEWFPTLLQGRLRVKALDPYCFMKPISSKGTIKSKDQENYQISYFDAFMNSVNHRLILECRKSLFSTIPVSYWSIFRNWGFEQQM